ncbi:MAG: hypothetical protein ACAH80_15695 [Alphaproteobacteria bacterium]
MPAKGTPDKKLVDLAFRIKPLLEVADGDLHFIKSPDLYRNLLLIDDVTPGVAALRLKPLTELKVELPVGMYDMHFPTAAQVLSQLPKRYHKIASAYSVRVTDGFLSGEEGYVNATVTLYKGPLPKSVSGETVVAMGKKFVVPKAAAPAFNPVAAVTAEKPIAVMKPLVFKKPEGPQP